MTDYTLKEITPHVEALVRDLEKMSAEYRAHVHAKQCVEKFWRAIQPKPITPPSIPNEAPPAADATSV